MFLRSISVISVVHSFVLLCYYLLLIDYTTIYFSILTVLVSVTKYHELGGLKPLKFIISQLRRAEVQNRDVDWALLPLNNRILPYLFQLLGIHGNP